MEREDFIHYARKLIKNMADEDIAEILTALNLLYGSRRLPESEANKEGVRLADEIFARVNAVQ